MKFENPKFNCYKDGKLCFDVTIIDGNNTIPYTYLEGSTSVIDVAIKNALDNGELVVDTTVKQEKPTVDLFFYRKHKAKELKDDYYWILNNSHIEYKDHLFYLNDYDKFVALYIINKDVNYTDVQNQKVELNKEDYKEIIELIMSERDKLISDYSNLKDKLNDAKTKEEMDSVTWDII